MKKYFKLLFAILVVLFAYFGFKDTLGLFLKDFYFSALFISWPGLIALAIGLFLLWIRKKHIKPGARLALLIISTILLTAAALIFSFAIWLAAPPHSHFPF